MALEPNDKPITHEDHLFDNGRVYGNRGSLESDCEAVRSEYWKPAGQIQESVITKVERAIEPEFLTLVGRCVAAGNPLSNYQQIVVKNFMLSVYQDGMIAALREQTDKEMKA